ncbi:hypothetical protein BD309DRAFT_1065929 [Dichomitus squalens]|uniref:Uncharacterized protein n=1 Tax=Dichomitus squalens TaxID=114155 RepID=A0A4Q9PK04_9APHY|nr:hypothetical protein BD309DRAFT_1065929 [Dichomitus squalens]TBU54447.1 hypothetical protein BD310DRAFT_961436 [Dichomitus squalens]
MRGLTSYFPRLPALPFTLAFNPFRTRSRPIPARTESEGSTYSRQSTSTCRRSTVAFLQRLPQSRALVVDTVHVPIPTALKDKRPLLLSTWSTSDKFTRKFPRPRALANESWLGPGASSVSTSGRTDEGGLGIDRPARWTPHKWCLVASVCTVLVYGSAGLVCAILTWFGAWKGADVAYVASYDLLVLLTLASSVLLLAALTGLSGALLNSRPLLALYALLLWPAFLALLLAAYPAYKRSAYALDRKLSRAWSEYYTPLGRLAIQDALHCCGFLTAAHDAAPSALCYPRTPLPGCKGALWRFQRAWLRTLCGALFALVPLHVLNILVALLCANHVTRTFGKGITPRRYRLSAEDVRADALGLMQVLRERGVGPLRRPGVARAGSSAASFREDKVRYGVEAERAGRAARRR